MSLKIDTKNLSAAVGSRENHYENLKLSDHIIESNGVACNSRYCAYLDSSGGSSVLSVLSLNNFQSHSNKLNQPIIIRGHTQSVQDVAFNPFHNNILASCSGDGHIKFWDIPSDIGQSEVTSPVHNFTDLPTREIAFHPFCENILLSRGSKHISIYDMTSPKSLLTNTDKALVSGTGDLQSICWNYDGNTIAITGKDKKIKILDIIRSSNTIQSSSIIAETTGHSSVKGSRVIAIGETPYILSSGHNSYQERELCMWDIRNLSECIMRERVDASTGLLMPIYDPDSGLLCIGGRNDSNIRIYDVNRVGNTLKLIQNLSIGKPIRGICMCPKQFCDTKSLEVLKLLTCHKTNIQDISVKYIGKTIPAMSDLYPPSYWNASPSLQASEWLQGQSGTPNKVEIPIQSSTATTMTSSSKIHLDDTQNNHHHAESSSSTSLSTSPSSSKHSLSLKAPNNIYTTTSRNSTSNSGHIMNTYNNTALSPRSGPNSPRQTAINTAMSKLQLGTNTSHNYTPTNSTKSYNNYNSNILASSTSSNMPKDNHNHSNSNSNSNINSNKRVSLSNFGSTLKFKHLYGQEAPHKSHTYFGLKPNTTSNGPIIACSELYWAVPYQGSGGGPVYVSRHDNVGKIQPHCPLINGHKAAVTDISFSPYHPALMATAGQDCRVKLWQLPESSTSELRSLHENDAIVSLSQFSKGIRTLDFHPTVDGLLTVTSQDMTVKLFDMHTQGKVMNSISLDLQGDSCMPNNLSYNHLGNLFALSCKDRCIRVVDTRSNNIVLTSSPTTPRAYSNGIGRNFRLTWCTSSNAVEGTILTVSSSLSGTRLVHIWDPRMLDEPLVTKSLDNGSGQLYPLYDDGSGICYVIGKGDTIIRVYELEFLKGIDSPSNITSTTATAINITTSSESGNDTVVSCDKATEFQTGREPITGMCLLPKRLCNIKDIEISKVLKLTADSVIPISFYGSRATNLKDYYQDDLYYPIRTKDSYYSIQQWYETDYSSHSSFFPIRYESLQPEGTLMVTARPVEAPKKTRVEEFQEQIKQKEADDIKRDSIFNHMQELANQKTRHNPLYKGTLKVDAARVVDDDEEEIDWDNEP